jgi:nucleoside phosphorylase
MHRHANSFTLLVPARDLCLDLMLLVTAAMEEELEIALGLCHGRRKMSNQNVSYWQAARGGETICFLKTGVGPRRSATSLERFLGFFFPSRILAIGYAGALDPDLRLGDLVAVKKALACSLEVESHTLEQLRLDRQYELTAAETIFAKARSAGLNACIGSTLTSAYVLGDPAHKRLLHEKYRASIVDMETAAIAGIAEFKAIPLSCVRVVSDEAHEDFLAPFSYNPSANLGVRAIRIVGTGIQAYGRWKAHVLAAGETLGRFLAHYL